MFDGLQLLKIQLYDLVMVRRGGEVKNFGVELERTNLAYFTRAYVSPLIIFALSLLAFARFRDKEKPLTAFWGAFGVVLASLLISFALTRRGADQFAPFMILTSLILFYHCNRIKKITAFVFAVHSLVVTGMFIQTCMMRSQPYNATDYRRGTEWLIAHTEPGEIVGQGVWSDFGPLFYWDRHNRFLGGMDPVFQYRFNPETYWLMTINAAVRDLGKTSKYNPAKITDKEEPISTAWPRDLHTKWLFCAADWNKEVQEEIRKDKHTRIAYQDTHAVIYEFGAK